MARQERDPELERGWRAILAEWRAGGVSVRAFCRRRRLVVSAFYFSRGELERRDAASARSSTPAFVLVTLVSAATVEVRCPSGHVVTLPNLDGDVLPTKQIELSSPIIGDAVIEEVRQNELLGFKPEHLSSGDEAVTKADSIRNLNEWTERGLMLLLAFALLETAWAWYCGRARLRPEFRMRTDH